MSGRWGRAEAGVEGLPTKGGDLAEPMRACLVALALPDQMAEAYRLPPRTLWPVQASIARIWERLAVMPDGGELAAFLPGLGVKEPDGFRVRSALASTLTAVLELACDGRLTLEQEEAWQTIGLRHAAKTGIA